MKFTAALFFLFTTLFCKTGFSQPQAGVDSANIRSQLVKYDLSILWTTTRPWWIFGYIGENYQRIQMVVVSVSKDPLDPAVYRVKGKSRVKNNICDFEGTIKVSAAYRAKKFNTGIDNEFAGKMSDEGTLIAAYSFKEDSSQAHSGVFSGTVTSYWFVDKAKKLCYDNSFEGADSYCNNQFEGKWKSYDGKIVKKCNWGDHRIPDSGAFDMGAGEFSPDNKYLEFGWENYRTAYSSDGSDSASKAARRKEQEEWWK